MRDWRDCTLGDALTLQRGFDLPTQDRIEGPFPVIASTGHVGTHHEAKVAGPGVVIGRSGSVGGGQFINSDFWPLNTTLWVKDFKGNNRRFCYYLLKSIDFAHFNAGSGVPTLNRNHIHPLPVRLPPRIEQNHIASLLGVLDDKIDLNRRMNETLEAMARALFKSWFVDFDPVHAKAKGRQPAYMDADTVALFPDALDEDGTPEGWEIRALGDIVQINPRERLMKGASAPYIGMADLPTGSSRTSEPVRRPFASGSKFRDGDTLLARITPCLENGKTGYVDTLDPGIVGWGSTEFIVLRAKPPVPKEYAYLLARSQDFRAHAIASMTGTSGRQRVQVDSVARFPTCIPSETICRRFGTVVASWFDMIKANAEQSATLADLRDTLLPKLMSGEIRLREAERTVEAVA